MGYLFYCGYLFVADMTRDLPKWPGKKDDGHLHLCRKEDMCDCSMNQKLGYHKLGVFLLA